MFTNEVKLEMVFAFPNNNKKKRWYLHFFLKLFLKQRNIILSVRVFEGWWLVSLVSFCHFYCHFWFLNPLDHLWLEKSIKKGNSNDETKGSYYALHLFPLKRPRLGSRSTLKENKIELWRKFCLDLKVGTGDSFSLKHWHLNF